MPVGRNTRSGLSAVLALTFAVSVACERTAEACAPAWRGAEPVQIASEEALIVWDAPRKLQHFVRTAEFHGGSGTFGFLVPVPALPEIAEADERIFETLEKFWESQRLEQEQWRFEGFTSLTLRAKSASVPAAAGVTVLATTRVAGMDAVVLDADSPRELAAWLEARAFALRPELVSYLEPYVRERFKIVAFQYARDASTPLVGSRAVRLSFATDRPFFPYREPRDAARPVPARFRLHVLAATSMGGVLGEARQPWAAEVRYSGPFTEEPPPFARLASPWITMFEELVQARPVAGDLYLEATPAPRPTPAPPRVVEKTWGIPVELALGAVLVAGAATALLVRRRGGGRAPLG
jgi:hypothetical protein